MRRVAALACALSLLLGIWMPAHAGGPLASDQLTSAQMTFGGVTRTYLLFVPASYSRRGAIHALAMVFHGYNNTDSSLVPYVEPSASRSGIVVAFPQGIGDSWNAGSCCGVARVSESNDVGFALALTQQLISQFHPRSVVTAGFSDGAMLSWLLACQPASPFTGLVDAAGTEGIPAAGCQPGHPVLATAVHGLHDQTVPFNGGLAPVTQAAAYSSPFRPITDVIDEWGQGHDACSRRVVDTFSGWSQTRWTGCRRGVQVTLDAIDGMGHDVPTFAIATPVDFGVLIAATAARAAG